MLGIDTCLGACSAALWSRDRGVLAARCETMQQGHAERLVPMIEEVLAQAGTSAGALEAIAVTVGPGTFTGVRIGIAAARGLALAAGLPVHTTTSLKLLAATARATLPDADGRPVAACVDARRGEVYLEISPASGSAASSGPRLVSLAQAGALILAAAPDALLVGSGAALVAAGFGALQAAGGSLEPDARHLAGIDLGVATVPVPLYIRAPDARPQHDTALSRVP